MNDTGFFGWYKCWYFAKWDFCKLPIYSNLRTEFDSTPRTISLDFQSLTLSVARGLIVLVSMEIFLLNRWNLLISHISPLIRCSVQWASFAYLIDFSGRNTSSDQPCTIPVGAWFVPES